MFRDGEGGGGGGGGNKLDFGVRENPRASPINETLVCVDSTVVPYLLLVEMASTWIFLST